MSNGTGRSTPAAPPADAATAPPAEPGPPERPAAPEIALDFALLPDVAERLPRLPVLLAHRPGRLRSTVAETVWFDTAAAGLAEAGLAVEAPKRGPRRLIRYHPEPTAPWHPGQPPGVLRDLTPQEVPDEAGEGPLVAVSAFTGRRQAFAIGLPQGAVAATLLIGRLRSVAAESEVARLTLQGPLPAVIEAARAIAGELAIEPPLASLAEEGRALATATPVRPLRLGAPDTSEATTAEDAFLRAAGHLLEVLRQQSARIAPGTGPEAVHQSRVALRRLRSLLRVYRGLTDCAALRGIDARLREAVSVLGPARDWDVFLAGTGAGIDGAFPGERRIASLLRAAEQHRSEAYEAIATMRASPAWRLLFIDALEILLTRPWRAAEPNETLDAPVSAFGHAVLDRRWQRLRRAGDGFSDLGAEALHELRLDGKRLRYAAEVFAPVFGARAGKRFLRRLAAVQDGLGIANDAAVARQLVQVLAAKGDAGRNWAIGVVEGWCEARVATHRGDALAAWNRLSGKDRFWTND